MAVRQQLVGFAKHLVPDAIHGELLRLARLDRDWVHVEFLEGIEYRAKPKYATWMRNCWHSGADAFAMWALSVWLLDGPKTFRPSVEQATALEQIELNIPLRDYAQPFPALLVDLPRDIDYAPFYAVLCHRTGGFLSASLQTPGNKNDIITTITDRSEYIEASVSRYDKDCQALIQCAGRALRVALNSCLALANFGCQHAALFPKDLASDQRLASENSDRGRRARERLPLSMSLVTFAQDVKLHRTVKHDATAVESQGGEKTTHWRRGHWAMQAYGPQHSLRKRILRPPVLVRADKFLGDVADTSTVIR